MRRSQLVLVALVLVAVLGCGKLNELVNKNRTGDPEIVKAKKLAEDAVTKDILADPPSPGAAVVRQLARLDPEAASLQKTIVELERSAIKKFAEKLTEEYNVDPAKLPVGARQNSQAAVRREPSVADVTPADRLLLGLLQASRPMSEIGVSSNDINLTVLITSYFNDLLSNGIKDVGSTTRTMRQENGESYSDMSIDIGRNADGSSKFGFRMNTRGHAGNRSLDSEFEGSLDGQRCPQLDGSVYFTAKIKLSGKSGDNTYIQDVTAKIIAHVNDDAEITSREIRINQGIQETAGINHTYVETEFQVTESNGVISATQPRVVRVGGDQGPHSDDVATAGNRAGMQAAMSALSFTKVMWQRGGCVAIDAKSPGSVQPSSINEIPVSVKHKQDGSSVPSKVTVQLAGGTFVSPMQIDQTPGKLSYTAPPEKNKSATIKLEARSKRGRATLDLNATTGGNAYNISGNIDEASMSGTTCDSSAPFTIGGTLTFQFTPTSATTGTYTYRGPYSATGSGPYVINDNGTMKLDGTGCIMGSNCATYSHIWKAEPIDPSSCGK